jgi:hemerythrin-like domain-containing protein
MSFSTLFSEHHVAGDTAFADAEAAGVDGKWGEAAPALERFATMLTAHFAAEEQTLFPAFEGKTGMTQGPTMVMRMEHEHMRALLARLSRALTAKDATEFAGAAETLLVLMQQHNLKEERMLYPMCDRALDGDAAVLSTCGTQLKA